MPSSLSCLLAFQSPLATIRYLVNLIVSDEVPQDANYILLEFLVYSIVQQMSTEQRLSTSLLQDSED